MWNDDDYNTIAMFLLQILTYHNVGQQPNQLENRMKDVYLFLL